MEKPDVDSIDGLSPAISIDQKTTSKNPRSTVGTVTEIYDYLRLLYAKIGVPHCPKCDTRMLVTYYGSHYSCPRCNFDSARRGKCESSHEIEALIYDNVRRKYFTEV